MPRPGDRDILLPQEGPRLHLLSRLRSILRRPGRSACTISPKQTASDIGPVDLWAAFEYLVGEYEAAGALREDLLDPLAATFARQAGQARFDLQCKLSAVLADRRARRFHAALRLATQVPVPQARTALLEMLTQPDLARWLPGELPEAANGNGQEPQGHDLRPAVIAALGQLRDPSLLGLFHRLLEKLSGNPAENQNLTAAVQWSLMNLAPGGHGEPVPASILSTRSPVRPDGDSQQAPSPVARASDDAASTAEAMRVVAAIRGRYDGEPTPPGGTGTSAPTGQGPSKVAQDPPADPSERDELLSGF